MEPIQRVLRSLGDRDVSTTLAGLAGADLTTLLLDVFKRRTEDATAAMVMRQRQSDRFVAPSRLDLTALHHTEATLLGALPDRFDTVVLSPLAPLGLHSAVASVDQGRLVTTIRRTDVAADPTTGLAIEGAVRRRALLATDPKSSAPVRLATIQRVVRAQRFDGPVSFPHFTMLGMVTAGRDSGSHRFEVETMADHAATTSRCLLAAGAGHITVTVTAWTGHALGPVKGLISNATGGLPVTVREDPQRSRARGYYLQGGFDVTVRYGDTTFHVADGGLVDWTQALLQNRKERLMISGIGVDRVAIALTQDRPPPDRS